MLISVSKNKDKDRVELVTKTDDGKEFATFVTKTILEDEHLFGIMSKEFMKTIVNIVERY